MLVEVMFVTTAKVAGHRAPAIISFQDGPLVRSLLKGGHAVLIDPPYLPGYNDAEYQEAIANSKQDTAEEVNNDPIKKQENKPIRKYVRSHE